jgi:DNA-binding transcriptional regulator YbjK
MADLRVQLDERERAEKFAAIARRGRAAFLEGAEAHSQAAEGRPLTSDELERVTKRCPR